MTLSRPTALRALLLAPSLLLGCRHSDFPDYPAGYREFGYVANSVGNTVTVLDLVYLRADRTLQVGGDPVALAANPTRNEVYVVNRQPGQPTGSVAIIDTKANTVAATIPVGREPASISIDSTGHLAYVANSGSNSISVLDLETRREIASARTAGKPGQAVITSDGRTLVVTSPDRGTTLLYAASPLGTLTLRATFTGCPGAASPVVLPDSSKAFIACAAGHQIMALNLAAAPDSWSARQDHSQTADSLIALLDVGKDPSNLTLKPDGGEVFVSNQGSDSISEVSTTSNEVGSTYPIGNRPAHGLVNADNSALWVSNAGADSLSLYSISDGRMVSSIHIGDAPDALAFSADQHILLAADTRSGDVAVIRTAGKLGPALFTLLPAGAGPAAIVTKSMQLKP